ncbi:hypothetical protein V6N13_050618 [Hibiscus sabdariffa]
MHLGGLLGFLFYIDIGETTLKVTIHQKIVKKSEADDNDSGCVAAVTLTGALQSGSSPIFSQIPYNKVECRKSTPVQSCDRMACGGKEPVIGSYRRDESTCLGALLTLAFLSTTMLPTSTVEVESDSSVKFNVNRITRETDEKSSASEATSIGHHRDKNNYVGPKEKVHNRRWYLLSIASLLQYRLSVVYDIGFLVTFSSYSLYVFFWYVFFMRAGSIQYSHSFCCICVCLDSSVKFNVNRITRETDEKSSASEATSIGHHRDKNNYVGPKEKPEPTSNSKKRMPFGNSQVATEYFDFWTSNLAFNTKSSVQAAHFKSRSFNCFPFLDNKDLAEEVNKSLTKGKCSAQSSVQSRQCKTFRVPEDSPTIKDPKNSETDSAVSTLQVPAEPELVSFPNKHQRRCKMNLKRALLSTDKSTSRYTLENQPNKQSLSEDRLKVESNPQAKELLIFRIYVNAFEFQENLSSCLSSDLTRSLEDCALLNGKLVSILTVKNFAVTDFTMQLVITAPLASFRDSVTGEIVEGSRLKTVSMVDAVIEESQVSGITELASFVKSNREHLFTTLRDEIESYDPARERVKMSEADDNDNGFALAVTLTGGIAKRKLPTVFSKTL